MGLQHPDHQFKSGCRLLKSDVVVIAMMSDFFLNVLFGQDFMKKRYDLIDSLRGLAIISMIGFHACFIMNYFGILISDETLFGPLFSVWERSICISFITIAGFSFSLGHDHIRSGLIVFGWGLIITIVTCLFLSDLRIIFGVLTLIGSSILLTIPIDKLLAGKLFGTKRPGVVLFIVSLLLFLFTYNINKGYLGFSSMLRIDLPGSLYSGYAATFFGFMAPGFYSADYFSLFPWFFLYLSGYFLHKIITGYSLDRFLTKGIPFVKVMGRHSLPIYIIHPIVLFIIFYCISTVL